MNDDALRNLLAQGLSEEEMARALLDLTLEAAPPDVADAVRMCALPAWFDAAHLALLADKSEREAADLVEQVAAFSFTLPRERGGYVYHESTRARLLDWWRKPEQAGRFAMLSERLARHYLALAREQDPRLSGSDYLDALAVLDAAYPNVYAAWEGAVASEHWELVRDFAYAQADYQDKRGLWLETQTWARKGLEACERLDDEAGRADMQIILGNAYSDLPTGDREANLQQAIECYREALRVYTPEAAPFQYATTQNNLGTAYLRLPTGDREANLQQAIECYREALRVYTPEAAPLDYAMTQNNLGTAYSDLPTGDREANLQQAIECYTAALQIEHLAPHDQAMYHRNRASSLIDLNRLDEAKQDCEQARTLAPDHHYTHARLGQLAFAHDDYAAAVEHYTSAIERQEEAGFYFDRGLAHLALGHQDDALADYQFAFPLADSITVAEAMEELEKFAVEHPDTPGLEVIRALFPSSS